MPELSRGGRSKAAGIMKTIPMGKPDKNQGEIIQALRKVGALVIVVSAFAVGFDLIVIFRGVIHLAEVKQPGEDLTEKEAKMQTALAEHGVKMRIWHSVLSTFEDVLG